MDDPIWANLSLDQLSIDQSAVRLEIDQDQIQRFYIPVARRLIDQHPMEGRLLVGIAGPPGSGKSTFATILSAVIDGILSQPSCAVVGQDGWHFPNAYLESQVMPGDGPLTSLRQLKGIPETFDLESLFTCLRKIKRDAFVTYPIYSRKIHDPIPDAGRIDPHHIYILVEGNYLLLNDPPWSKIEALFDYTIFLTAPRSALLEGLRERHLRGGKSEQETVHHLQVVDEKNIDLVLAGSHSPDLLVTKADSRRIAQITFQSRP